MQKQKSKHDKVEDKATAKAEAKARRRYDKRKYSSLRFAIELVVCVIIFLCIFSMIVGISRVDGQSMYPTLKNRQVVLYQRLGNNYEVGDIVAIKMPNGDRYVKRVIAKEGDKVDIKDGKVYVNDKEISEPYVNGVTEEQGGNVKYPYTVEKGAVFVLGDNRAVSIDSRTFGAVIIQNIKGKLFGNK